MAFVLLSMYCWIVFDRKSVPKTETLMLWAFWNKLRKTRRPSIVTATWADCTS